MAPRAEVVAAGLKAHNSGRSLRQWAKTARVAEVNALARQLGLPPRRTKAATVTAIEGAARTQVVEDGHRRLVRGRSIGVWARGVRRVDVLALAKRVGVPAGTKVSMIRQISDNATTAKTLADQGAGVRKLLAAQTSQYKGVFDNARRWLFEALSSVTTTSSGARLRAQSRMIRQYGHRLLGTLNLEFGTSQRDIHGRVVDDLSTLLQVPGAKSLMSDKLHRQAVLELHKLTFSQFVSGTVLTLQRAASARVHVEAFETAQALAGKRSVVTGLRTRALALVQAEVMRAYNDGQISAAGALNLGRGRKAQKRIEEVTDGKNHPFSRAASGTRADLDAPFRVKASEVERWAVALGRSALGVFWAQRGEYYEGPSLPAHFNDRGRVIIEVVPV